MLMSLCKLFLCDPLPHRTCTAYTSRHHLEHIIYVIRSTPLLVRDNVAPALHLRLLDQLPICAHPAFRVLT